MKQAEIKSSKSVYNSVLPSGKQPHNYGKSPFLMGKSTISMAIFPFSIAFCMFTRGYLPSPSHSGAAMSLRHVTWPHPIDQSNVLVFSWSWWQDPTTWRMALEWRGSLEDLWETRAFYHSICR